MSKKFKKSRRNFLEKSLLMLATPYALTPFDQWVGMRLLQGGLSKAYANNASVAPRRYISVSQAGAPARWMYDLFLTPYSTNNYIQNPSVATCFKANGGRYDELSYETALIKGINAPIMWGQMVANSSGGQRPMSDLLDNLLCVQGVTTGNAGHPGSTEMHYTPLGALQSMSATVADNNPSPLEAVSMVRRNYKYKSNGNSSLNDLSQASGNLIDVALASFRSNLSGSLLTNSQLVGAVADNLDTEIEDHFIELHKRSLASVSSREKSRDVTANFNLDFGPIWTGLLNKYQAIINNTLNMTNLPKLTDLPIGTLDTRGVAYRLGTTTNVLQSNDLRDVFSLGMNASFMASHFALAEYLILNDLSYAVNISPGTITNLQRIDGNNSRSMAFDQHQSGAITTLIGSMYFFRALSACLLEFTDQLKTKGYYNDSVVEVFGEFNRSPKANLSGSDHGWQGKSVALYSGAINGPVIIGDLSNSTNNTYPGTWGVGAHSDALGKQLDLSVLSQSIADLLRVPTPFSAKVNPAFQLNSNGSVNSFIGQTKIVA